MCGSFFIYVTKEEHQNQRFFIYSKYSFLVYIMHIMHKGVGLL